MIKKTVIISSKYNPLLSPFFKEELKISYLIHVVASNKYPLEKEDTEGYYIEESSRSISKVS